MLIVRILETTSNVSGTVWLHSPAASAGVRYIKPHGMRRTCASVLGAFDIHSRIAMRILRHSKISITMEIYTEALDDSTRDALRRLGEQLGQDPPLLHFAAAARSNKPVGRWQPASDLGGRYWDRTSDLLGVNEALSR
jgi:hypothetical protein